MTDYNLDKTMSVYVVLARVDYETTHTLLVTHEVERFERFADEHKHTWGPVGFDEVSLETWNDGKRSEPTRVLWECEGR